MSYPPSWKFDLDVPPDSPGAPDDEFDSTSLDGKWTVVAGSPGTVGITDTDGGRYDLTSRPGWLLMQAEQNEPVMLRQDYTLADGASIVVKIAPSILFTSITSPSNNTLTAGIGLNNDNDDYDEGDALLFRLRVDNGGWRILAEEAGGAAYSTPQAGSGVGMGHAVYLRVLRDGLDYYCSFSFDGTVWVPFSAITLASAADNLWLYAEAFSSQGTPTPAHAVDFVRLGSDDYDPW